MKVLFGTFFFNGLSPYELWNIVPKETSNNAGTKSPKISSTWLDDALRVL